MLFDMMAQRLLSWVDHMFPEERYCSCGGWGDAGFKVDQGDTDVVDSRGGRVSIKSLQISRTTVTLPNPYI
jgi:hypothetical protein